MPPRTQRKIASQPEKTSSVLIVDDHPVFRAGLAGLVNLEPDLAVCGEAHDAAQALSALEKGEPDLLLLDMSLPGSSGLDLLKEIRARHPRVPVLVISMHDETLYAERVVRAGGRGYIMKQEGPEKIVQAMRKVLCGGISVSEKISSLILDALSGSHGPRQGAASVSALTDREFEVYRFIGQGMEPQAVARHLKVSIKTVDTHRSHIKSKLGLQNNTELVHHATRWTAEQA